MNDFAKDLEYSHACEDEVCWRQIYQAAFPTMLAMPNHREDGQHQRNGIDRSIILSNSKQLLIDEKARRIKDTGDIMLEYISNDRTNTPGWVEKSILADYIAYAFIPSGTAYLFPVVQLQGAWAKKRDEWIARYGTRKAQNAGYWTHNCPVPTNALFQSIGQMLRVNFTPIDEHPFQLE
jgi:hypothetical protein